MQLVLGALGRAVGDRGRRAAARSASSPASSFCSRGRVAVEEDLEPDLVADLGGLRLARAQHRDEHPEQQGGDHDRDDRGDARRGAATQRAEGLGEEEDDPSHGPAQCSKPGRLVAHAHLGAHACGELLGRLVLVVAGRGLVADQAALLEGDHAAAHLVDHLAVVGDDEHGRAGAVDPVEQLHDPDRRLGVEVAGRLVGEQKRRVVDERAGDRDALLLAARELVGVVVDLRLQADQPEDLGHLAADLRARLADHLQRVGDVVVHGAVREQLEVLEHGPDPAPQVGRAVGGHRVDVLAGDLDGAGGGLDLADQHLDQRRLAAAGRAGDEGELAATDLEREVLERDVAAGIDDGRVVDADDRRAGGRLARGRAAGGRRRCSPVSRSRVRRDLRVSSGMRGPLSSVSRPVLRARRLPAALASKPASATG